MTVRPRPLIRFLGVGGILLLLAAALPTSQARGSRASAPRSGGGHHAGAPAHRGAPAPRASAPSGGHPSSRATAGTRAVAAPRGTAPAARRTANGVARYGYGYGYGYGTGYGYGYPYYPYWGAGYGFWGAGWYGGWGWGFGWGWPGYGYAAYDPWYGPYPDTYIATVEAPAPTGPAIVETGVTPSKAGVVLDGETVGFASDYNGRWDELTVAPGPHTISFQDKGYRTLVVTFEARPGAKYVFDDALVPGSGEDHRSLAAPTGEAASNAPESKPTPMAVGRLRVRAEPADAAVYLDGEYLGLGAELSRIHGALAVATGTHRLEAVRPGYVSASRVIEVGGKDVLIVELTLEPQR